MDENKARILFLESDFLEEMNGYRLARKFTDIELICKNGVVTAHGALLATASLLLRNINKVSQTGHDVDAVFLPDFDVDIVNSVLELLYTGHAKVAPQDQYLKEIKSFISSIDVNIISLDVSKPPENTTGGSRGCSKCPNVHFTHRRGVLRHYEVYHPEDQELDHPEDQELYHPEDQELYHSEDQLCQNEDQELYHLNKQTQLHMDKGLPNEGIELIDTNLLPHDSENNTKDGVLEGKPFGEPAKDEVAERVEIVSNSLDDVCNGQVELNNATHDSVSCQVCRCVINKSDINNHFQKKHPHHFVFQADCLSYRSHFGIGRRIKIHGKVEEVRKCNICDKDIKRSYLKQHYYYHSNKRDFKCMHCDKEFVSQSNLNEHCSRHHGRSCNGVCPVCGKMFKLGGDLKKHLDIQHEPEKFKCSICQRKFRTKLNYNDHVRTHTGEKPFFCDVCGKSFGRRATLNIHIRIHTGEKRYKCSDCNQAFINSSHRLRHRREVHLGIKRETLEYKELSDANQANNYTGKRMKVKARKNRRNYRKLTENFPARMEIESDGQNMEQSIDVKKQIGLNFITPKKEMQSSKKKPKTIGIRMDLKRNSNIVKGFSVFTSTVTSFGKDKKAVKSDNPNNECLVGASNESKESSLADNTIKNWDFVILGEEQTETA